MKLKIIDYGYKKTPTRAHHNDSGIDCYALTDIVLKPFGSMNYAYDGLNHDIGITWNDTLDRAFIPLGFGFEIPDGYELQVRPKSSMNARGIITQFGTVDAGYTGEIKAVLINTSNEEVVIKKGEKICQLVLCPVVYFDPVEKLDGERANGGFGSTGK